MTRECRYFALLAGWLALFLLPAMAGEWYDEHFHVYQSLTSLMVIGLARKLYPLAWWADDLAVVAMLQIVHAAADFATPASPELYNAIQAGFNVLEVAFLAIGGVSEWLNGRFDTARHTGAGRHPDSRNHERKSHA